MKNIVIIGAGGFAREVKWLIEDINKSRNTWNIMGFIDENLENKDTNLNGNLVLGSFDILNNKRNEDIYYVCAVGDPVIKKALVKKADKIGLKPATLIHPSVIMSDLVEIGEGTVICAGCILTVNIKLGKHVIVNIDSTIGHDATINDYTTILPSVNISGNTLIDEGVSMGTGSSIIQGLKIGKFTTIGAGAVVVKDIPCEATAVGIPAKVIKKV